jgi:hypothetical protein
MALIPILATEAAFQPNSGYFGSLIGPVALVVGRIDAPLGSAANSGNLPNKPVAKETTGHVADITRNAGPVGAVGLPADLPATLDRAG